MVLNATFNNISLMFVSFIGGGNQSTWRKPPICHKSMTNVINHIMLYRAHLAWAGFKLITLVVQCNQHWDQGNKVRLLLLMNPMLKNLNLLSHYS